jgi:phosphate transport system ATP-binding protein
MSDKGLAIETKRLNLWYGSHQALRNVNVGIQRGKITSLIGPSGCGKSTLLRCVNRMNERLRSVRVEGEVRVLGHDVNAPEVSVVELRKRVGMVFQRPNPLPVSIAENILYGLRIHARYHREEAACHIEASLKAVGLWEALQNRLTQDATALSLEQQQKLCIARLLPMQPEVILMDEPCSALDAEGTKAVEDLMRGMAERYTVVIVTHNMAQARRVSEECIFMLMGEVVEHSATAAMFEAAQDERTRMYLEGRFG